MAKKTLLALQRRGLHLNHARQLIRRLQPPTYRTTFTLYSYVP